MSEKIDLSSFVLSETEEFMNTNQRAYFRAKLNAWKNDILREARKPSDIWPRKVQTTLILQTEHRRKPTGPSSSGQGTGSAS